MCFSGRVDIKEQEGNLEEAKKQFQTCCAYFVFKPKTGESEVSPKDFFSLWSVFCSEFKDLWKKEQQRIMKQK